ncbi:hypothetical protein [Paraclostridium sordellii]|uniref:hypothetical protein n=1 Tax=Paraclostridium sordellii TaxID=1505 RepID=UPI0005E2D8B9|nr:hypothetical protein [Paeniclostridium sordellii]CEP43687.1 Uncharacterised protein [[Clostridium] sordellii] [Paeniclostridium sordellii]CEP50459.1 Uncharacterised protein [[Clostridium] sordellii] [Paeniclostridium sordellii]
MATKAEKDILDRMSNTTNNLREYYFTKMLKAQTEVNDLKKQIADGDVSEETQQKLIEAEKELDRVIVGYYESRD